MDSFGVLRWNVIVYGIWYVNGCCVSFYYFIENVDKEFDFWMFGIFSRKFDIIGIFVCLFDWFDGLFDYLIGCYL